MSNVMNMTDIRKRINIYRRPVTTNIQNLVEQCKTSSSINIFEECCRGWENINPSNEFAFIEFANIFKTFTENCKNKSVVCKAVNIFSEEVIQRLTNPKKVKHIVENLVKQIECDNIKTLNESLNRCIAADRVINNQLKLSKRFNIDNFIRESNATSESNIYDSIVEFCTLIDTYNMDFPVKYNVALENVLYSFEKNGIKCDKSFILETVTDYFLCNDVSDENKASIKKILEENPFYEDDDKKQLQFILNPDEFEDKMNFDCDDVVTEANVGKINRASAKDVVNKLKLSAQKSPEVLKQFIKKLYTKSPENIIDETPNFLTWVRTAVVVSTAAVNPWLGLINIFIDQFIALKLKRSETEKMLNKLKHEQKVVDGKISKTKDAKKRENLEQLKKTLDNNVDKIEDYYYSLHSDKEKDELDEKKYANEGSNLLQELAEMESMITFKEYMNVYHSTVVSELMRIGNELGRLVTQKYKNLITDKVLVFIDPTEVKKFQNINDSNYTNYLGLDKKFTIKMADFLPLNLVPEDRDPDTVYDMLSDICDTVQMKTKEDYCVYYDGSEDMYGIYLSFNLPIETEDSVIEEKCMHQDLVKNAAIILALESEMDKVSDEDIDDVISIINGDIEQYDVQDLDTLTKISIAASDFINPEELVNIYSENRLENYKKSNVNYYRTSCLSENEFTLKNINKNTKRLTDIYETYNYLSNVNEVISCIKEAHYQIINELSAGNTIRIVLDKLKKNALNLSDKEKIASRTLDASLSNFYNNIQKKLTNDNREAVIKGSILPSASKIIKFCIGTGIVSLMSPAIAVVGAIGAIAISKMANIREKQFILDEIEINLRLVEKKIQLAENNNDMKALEELLKIEQKLKREKTRIQYNMKNYQMPHNKD